MLILKQAKLEALCSKEDGKRTLHNPYLDLSNPDDPRLVATNGQALVAIKPEAIDEKDQSGWVSIDALKAARKAGPRAEIICDGQCSVPTGATFPRPLSDPDSSGLTFPDWRQLMPPDTREEMSIDLDAALLKRLVDAAGGNGPVRISFPVESIANGRGRAVINGEPYRVEILDNRSTIAVLMPLRGY